MVTATGGDARRARDRDPAGRPRNARPRDDLGRPLPRDAGGQQPLPDDRPWPRMPHSTWPSS